MPRHDTHAAGRPRIEWPALLAVALAIIAIHAAALTRYGWFRDELYYLSCAKRLAWGYVDEPPFSIAVLALLRTIGGESLAIMRAAAAVLGAAGAIIVALIAGELGGRRFAQIATALAFGLAPISLGIGHFYSMNVFDVCFWGLATLLALRAFESGTNGAWFKLGVALGLGLLNKWSVMWLGAGIAVTFVASPQRRQLLTPGPWLAAGTAAVLFAPHVLWEIRTGWPTLEFMHNARTQKMVALEPLKFLLGQMLALGPAAAPIWIAGLVAALARPRWRLIAIVYLLTLAILLASGSARVEYITLPCAALFAAGAVWWESRGRIARGAMLTLAVVLALPLAPLAMPLLSVSRFIAYQRALGRSPQTEERHRMGPLPQQYADMFGWPEFADSIARVTATLSPAERESAIVVVGNYGEAGALERFGAGRVPTVVCQHNSWYFWGPPKWNGGVAILVGRDSSEATEDFGEVHVVGKTWHPLAMPYENDQPILIARHFKPDLAKAWAQGKHYD
jgi:4-amino-4-deoxy-L-arabinose transferase-like glycosyltransferase